MTQTLSCNVKVNNSYLPNVAPNDIYLDSQGNISISRDVNAILEECAQVARVILGEMIFNTDLGVPYFQTVWVGVPNIPQFTNALRQSFLNVAGVIEVVSLFTEQGGANPSDNLAYTAIIRTIYGTGTING